MDLSLDSNEEPNNDSKLRDKMMNKSNSNQSSMKSPSRPSSNVDKKGAVRMSSELDKEQY